MFLDADEVLVADDAQRLREILGRTWREAFYLVETNFTGELGDGTAVTHNAMRVFRNRPEYRFEGRIHEQIAHNLPSGQPERIEITDVRVEHYGYLGVVRDAKDKSRRNIELLERQRDEGAGEDSGFLHFNLGSEYAALGENEDACASFETAWQMMRGKPDLAAYGYIPALVARLVRARRSPAGSRPRSISPTRACASARLHRPRLRAGAGRRRGGPTATAIALYERCLQMGDAPSRYSATAGARQLPRPGRAGRTCAARPATPPRPPRCWRRCLDEHPQYLGAVGPYAVALLATGADAAEVAARGRGARRRSRPRAPASSSAPRCTRPPTPPRPRSSSAPSSPRQPQNAGARVALAEALLSQRRWAEAAEAAAGVADGAARRRRAPHRAVRPHRRRRRVRRRGRRGPRRRRPRPRRARRLRRLAAHRRAASRRSRSRPTASRSSRSPSRRCSASRSSTRSRPSSGDRALGPPGPQPPRAAGRTSTCAAASSSRRSRSG